MSDDELVSVPSAPELSTATQDTIRDVYEAGTSDNTRRAYAGDSRQFWAWAGDHMGLVESYPVPVNLVLEYITAHLDQHAVSTIERRIASLSVAHGLAGVDNPCRDPRVRSLLSKAKRSASKQGKIIRKMKAATADIVDAMMGTCGDDLLGIRDRAILSVGFASGGRRRSELAAFQVDDLERAADGFTIRLRSSKTDQAGQGATLPVLGKAAAYLDRWLTESGITTGPLFRSINRHGRIGPSISGKAIYDLVRKRAGLAGLDPKQFGGHSLRSGFVTEAGRRGVPAPAAMALSRHRSSAIFNGYYESGDVLNNPAGKLLGAGMGA